MVSYFIQPTTHQYYTRGSTGHDFGKFTHHRSARVVNLLGKTLTRKYPKFKDELTLPLNDLLEWDLWPAYVSIYGLYSKIVDFDYYTCQ